MNYSEFESDKFRQHEKGLEELLMKRAKLILAKKLKKKEILWKARHFKRYIPN
jgi:hypothetical protein